MLDVTIEAKAKLDSTSYEEKLTKVLNWSEQVAIILEETKNAFGKIEAQEW